MALRDEVIRAAGLARLSLEPHEVTRLAAELRTILDHVATLAEVDTAGVPPFVLPAPAPGMRDDTPGADPLAHEPAAMAPAWRDGFYIVPRLESHGGPEAP